MNLISESQKDNIENIKKLLLNGADLNLLDKYGDTSLIRASRLGHFEVVKLLLLNGADINIQTKYGGETALYWASRFRKLEIVKLLLLNGANVNLPDKYGYTALMWVSHSSHYLDLKIVKLLTRKTEMEEWRPWNHCNLSSQYQDTMSTLLLLAKIKMNYNWLFNTITIYYGSYIRVSKGQYREY